MASSDFKRQIMQLISLVCGHQVGSRSLYWPGNNWFGNKRSSLQANYNQSHCFHEVMSDLRLPKLGVIYRCAFS